MASVAVNKKEIEGQLELFDLRESGSPKEEKE